MISQLSIDSTTCQQQTVKRALPSMQAPCSRAAHLNFLHMASMQVEPNATLPHCAGLDLRFLHTLYNLVFPLKVTEPPHNLACTHTCMHPAVKFMEPWPSRLVHTWSFEMGNIDLQRCTLHPKGQ